MSKQSDQRFLKALENKLHTATNKNNAYEDRLIYDSKVKIKDKDKDKDTKDKVKR